MKRVGLIAAAALAAVSLASVPSIAETAPDVDICKQLKELNLVKTVGECVSAQQKPPLEFCKWLKEIGALQNPPVLPPPIDWRNLGDCISAHQKN